MVRVVLALCAMVAAILMPSAGAGAEDLPTYSPQVSAALDVLDQTSATSDLRGVMGTNQVEVHFVPMAPGVYARYNVAHHVIEIDERWIDSDQVTLAAVLAHEATHAKDAVNGYLSTGGAGACIDSEVRAFRTSALFWIAEYGPSGKPDATSDLDRQLNSIADQQLHNPQGLENLVRQTYSQQCSP